MSMARSLRDLSELYLIKKSEKTTCSRSLSARKYNGAWGVSLERVCARLYTFPHSAPHCENNSSSHSPNKALMCGLDRSFNYCVMRFVGFCESGGSKITSRTIHFLVRIVIRRLLARLSARTLSCVPLRSSSGSVYTSCMVFFSLPKIQEISKLVSF